MMHPPISLAALDLDLPAAPTERGRLADAPPLPAPPLVTRLTSAVRLMRRRARQDRMALAGVAGMLVLATAGVLIAGLWTLSVGGRLDHVTRDPAAQAGGPATLALVSTLGMCLWTGAALACAMGLHACRLRRAIPRGQATRTPVRQRASAVPAGLFAWAGALSLMLLADDQLMLHESIFPRRLGVPETATLATYAAAAVGMLIVYRRTILRHYAAVLLTAGGLLAASLAVDQLVRSADVNTFVEDAFKFLGIAAWAAYWALLAATAARAAVAEAFVAGKAEGIGRTHPRVPGFARPPLRLVPRDVPVRPTRRTA